MKLRAKITQLTFLYMHDGYKLKRKDYVVFLLKEMTVKG